MTNYSEGKILASSYSTFIDISGNKVLFKDQIKSTKMSEIGDLCSLVVNYSNKAIGMIISGGKTQTAITPIKSILEHFDIYL